MKKLLRTGPGLGQVSSAPVAADKLIHGQPTTTTAHQFTNADNNFHCGVWGSDAGKWQLNYTEDEFCYIISGEAIVEDAEGHRVVVAAGDAFVIPAGFTGSWETPVSVQKYYAIYEQTD